MVVTAIADALDAGRLAHALDLIEDALAAEHPPAIRLQVLAYWAQIIWVAGRSSDAATVAQQIRQLLACHPGETQPVAALAFIALAYLHLMASDVTGAVTHSRLAIEAAAAGDRRVRTDSYRCRAIALEAVGDIAGALGAWEETAIASDHGYPLLDARAELGRRALLAGDYDMASHNLSKAFDFSDPRAAAVVGKVLGAVAALGERDPSAAVRIVTDLAAQAVAESQCFRQ